MSQPQPSLDNKLDLIEQRIAFLTEKYAELQKKTGGAASEAKNEEDIDPKDAEIADLKKQIGKLNYRIDFLVNEIIKDREAAKKAAQ